MGAINYTIVRKDLLEIGHTIEDINVIIMVVEVNHEE